MTGTTQLDGGFTAPVFQSQAVFRLVMDAMAQPGRIVDLGRSVQAPPPLESAAAAFLATLADYDTPVWFEDSDADTAASWLTFHTGAKVANDPATASFAALSKDSQVSAWRNFTTGSLSYPDRSATLLLPVESLRDGTPHDRTTWAAGRVHRDNGDQCGPLSAGFRPADDLWQRTPRTAAYHPSCGGLSHVCRG
jgi:alpha-D-ribose 1-methylphosphonate 5-triphosphate synthase subunit PhnH